jgi:predicted dehydrogenase
VYGTITGKLTEGFQPTIFGTGGTIAGTRFGDVDLTQPGDRMPHHEGVHIDMEEKHVFEDLMQLVDWIRLDQPSIASAEHARHVVEIIEAGYRAAETGQTQDLTSTFDPVPLEALAELA